MYVKRVLPNGVRLITERINNMRTVSVGIWVGNGSRYEPAELGGVSHFIEHMIFKGTEKRSARYRYTEELTRMGANIHVDGAIAVVEGVKELNGAPVRAHDLRAGAAMVIAGLAAKGVTEVEQVQNIERGYETLVEKFVALGADMYRSEIPENSENK